MFVGLCLKENPLYADEGSTGHPNPHSLFQIGMWGRRNPAVHQGLDGINLFVRDSRWYSVVAKDPNYALRLQYVKANIGIHGGVDEEIAWEKGKVYPLSTIPSTAPTLDQGEKRIDIFLPQAIIDLLLMSGSCVDGVPIQRYSSAVSVTCLFVIDLNSLFP